jgi:hypothetical protein
MKVNDGIDGNALAACTCPVGVRLAEGYSLWSETIVMWLLDGLDARPAIVALLQIGVAPADQAVPSRIPASLDRTEC